jgi:hypothetical protein
MQGLLTWLFFVHAHATPWHSAHTLSVEGLEPQVVGTPATAMHFRLCARLPPDRPLSGLSPRPLAVNKTVRALALDHLVFRTARLCKAAASMHASHRSVDRFTTPKESRTWGLWMIRQ